MASRTPPIGGLPRPADADPVERRAPTSSSGDTVGARIPAPPSRSPMFRRALMSAVASAGAVSLFAGSAGARNYYVVPTGSDSAAGTQQAPWRTVSRVNSASLAPGDVVRFAGGGVWHAMLAPTVSGTAEAPITFGTYVSGPA